MNFEYSSQDFFTEIPVIEYISRFNNIEKFIGFCKECKNYNKLWVCPPFNYDPLNEIRQFNNVLIVATRITPVSTRIPLSQASELIREERIRIEEALTNLEKEYNGKALAFAGSCLYCEPGTCTRKTNHPCRQPENARPSLEAYGFDIGATLKSLFNQELLWSNDGFVPDYLTLVCAFFHNQSPNSIKVQQQV